MRGPGRAALALILLVASAARAADPLPSWNDTKPKQALVAFVEATTREGADSFVPPPERIATFDNDGTLWVEQPMYVQLAFVLDRVKALAKDHPDWATKQPFKGAIESDFRAIAATGDKGLLELVAETHAGMSTEDFEKIVSDWIESAQHPRFHRPYTETVYQPMLELLAYLRANGFKTYIVSGGGVEFMRPWTERVYGVPPEQVIGSSIVTEYQVVDKKPVLMRLPKLDFLDDKAGKPVGIQKFIGRRPVLAFGNSDGDDEMLQWTQAGGGTRFMGLVHHTDAEREYAYDRKSAFGKLDKALDDAKKQGWVVVDMKTDWKTIFPSDR